MLYSHNNEAVLLNFLIICYQMCEHYVNNIGLQVLLN